MDEARKTDWYASAEYDIEKLKEIFKNAKVNLRSAQRKIIKSKINTGISKTGTFLKTSVNKVKNAIGLMPYNIAKGYNKLANYVENKRTIVIKKRTERRKWVISKVDTAKAKVGNFKKRVINNFKKAVNKVKAALGPDPVKKAQLKEELQELRDNLKAQREINKELLDEGSYKNLKGSRGIVNSFALFAMLLFSSITLAIFLAFTLFR